MSKFSGALRSTSAAVIAFALAMLSGGSVHADANYLAISMSVNETQALVGDQLNYLVTVTNTSSLVMTHVTMTSHIPSNTTEAPINCGVYVNPNDPDSTCIDPNVPTPGLGDQAHQINSGYSPLNPGQTITFFFAVTINSGTAIGTVIANHAHIQEDVPTQGAIVTSNIVNTVVTSPTTLTNTGPTSGVYDDAVSPSATLKDQNSNGVANETINFAIGSQSCSGVTSSNGTATCTLTIAQAAGSYTLGETFAGDGTYHASATSAPFTTGLEDTTISIAAPQVVKAGSAVSLSATLAEDGTASISGRSVSLKLGSASCTAQTGGTGVATCSVTAPSALGSVTAQSTFAGDQDYAPSSSPVLNASVIAPVFGSAFSGGSSTISGGGFVDSYNSNAGSYAATATHSGAKVGSNGDVVLSGGSIVYGDATPGPGHSVNLSGGSIVTGSTAPAPAPVTLPSIDTSPFKNSNSDSQICIPASSCSGVTYTASTQTLSVNGTMTLGAGAYYLCQLNVTGTLNITGSAVIYFGTPAACGGQSKPINIQSGTVQVAGDQSRLLQVIVPGDATTTTTVTIQSRALFTGILYAPQSSFTLAGTASVRGAVTAGSVSAGSGGSSVHYDSALNG